MVELEYNGERYMVDGGKWYRRLKVGEVVNSVNQMRSSLDGKWVQCSPLIGGIVSSCEVNDYRVPCTDPRPPFVVGQMVRVARKDAESGITGRHLGTIAEVIAAFDTGNYEIDLGEETEVFPPWCLDPVEPLHEDALAEMEMERIERDFPGYMDSLCGDEPDNDPELEHILRKLKPHTHLAADVRRIKRECYQKLAALLPEEKR